MAMATPNPPKKKKQEKKNKSAPSTPNAEIGGNRPSLNRKNSLTEQVPTIKEENGKTSKKRKHTGANDVPQKTNGTVALTLAQRIEETAQLIDSFVDLIPAKFYLAEEPDQSEINNPYWKNPKQKSPKQNLKESSKKAKKLKVDPEQAKVASEAIVEKKLKEVEEKLQESSKDEDEAEDKANAQPASKGLLGTLILSTKNDKTHLEELRSRLHERIEFMQKKRKADQQAKKERPQKKQKTSADPNKPIGEILKNGNKEKQVKVKTEKVKEEKPKPAVKKEEDSLSFQFGTFDFSTGKPTPTYLVEKKPSKVQLLKEAEKKQKVLEELKGTEKAKQIKYKTMEDKAAGIKVKDDPTLLRKAIRKEKSMKRKSAAQWAERLKQVKDEKNTKQQKRRENIEEHLKKKREKKAGIKKEKGPNRAGFEGKKKEFLNKEEKK